MNLHDGLRRIAEYLDLDADELIAYAEQDQIGGWDYDHYKHHWPTGSIFGAEGQILYALVRGMNVLIAAELGTWAGCSASHMAQALIDDDTMGSLTCVDPDQNAGYLIVQERAGPIVFERRDRLDYLASVPDNRLDLLFNDTPQDVESGAAIAREAQRVLRPGGVYVVHDAEHFLVGEEIQAGIRAGGINDHLTVKIDDTDCGLAIWRKPGDSGQWSAVSGQPVVIDPALPDSESDRAGFRLIRREPALIDDSGLVVVPESQESDENYVSDYTDWTVVDLQTELDRRGIPYKGRDRKDVLIAKLEGRE